MINDCGSILVKDNGLYCSNCVDYVSQCIAMTVYLLVIFDIPCIEQCWRKYA